MMQPKQPKTLFWFTGIAFFLLIAGTGAAWWSLQSLQPRQPNANQPTDISPQTPNTLANQAQLYWLNSPENGQSVEPSFVTRPLVVAQTSGRSQLLQTALEQLFSQSPPATNSTAIPPQTRLLSLKVVDRNIYLDLSPQFTEGGGSDSMIGRLGQVIYTATSLEPQGSVWISVAGQPLETLGGEGLIISQPMTRQIFEQDFQSKGTSAP